MEATSMKHSSFSFAWLIWFVAVGMLALAGLLKLYSIVLCMGIILFPLSGFLAIRGVLRWTGKQWRHQSTRG